MTGGKERGKETGQNEDALPPPPEASQMQLPLGGTAPRYSPPAPGPVCCVRLCLAGTGCWSPSPAPPAGTQLSWEGHKGAGSQVPPRV